MSLCIPYISPAINFFDERWNNLEVSLSPLISLFRILYRFFIHLHGGVGCT